MTRVVIVGAGGHARSVIEALRTGSRDLEPVACTDPNPALINSSIDGVPVIGDDEHLTRLREQGVSTACLGVGGVGDNTPRIRLFERLQELAFELPPVVHGRAEVAISARLGAAAQVLAGAIVGPGAILGQNVIVNSGAIVEHDCRVDDHVHLATASALAGGVHVQQAAHVGLGACVLQGLNIGQTAIVGAGAVVTRSVPPDQIATGCPASAVPRTG